MDTAMSAASAADDETRDVIIIGAGLSGIGAACVLTKEAPEESFLVLEARDAIGGTWDLFRYPGIRSDSDMYTLGYIFKPWMGDKALADGESIRNYVIEAADEFGVTPKIRFGHSVQSANWCSQSNRWTLTVLTKEGEEKNFHCRFLYCCAGYYNYAQGYKPAFPEEESFAGQMIHPQHWPEDLDYSDKNVVVVGSGATAVTLVPAMAGKAKKVTMLQRSPSYVMSLPAQDRIAAWLRRNLPSKLAYSLARWKNIGISQWFFQLARRRPQFVRKLLRKGVRAEMGTDYAVDTHFNPRYDPWDQRLCFVPDGDLFKAVSSGRAEIVTDTIAGFSADAVRLNSGQEIPADIVVSATGLDLQLMGGMTLSVDGQTREAKDAFIYRGMMVQDVPNFVFTVGYTNASWTLKADLVAAYVARLLRHMRRNKLQSCVPQMTDASVDSEPLIDFSSGYVTRKLDELPRQGSKAPWKLYQNYLRDRIVLAWGRLNDGAMQFR